MSKVRTRASAVLRPRRGQEGFTMVEVIVAMLILAVAVLTMARVTGQELMATLHTRQRQAAITAVNTQVASLRSGGYNRLALDPSQLNGVTTYQGSTIVQGSSGCATNSTCLKLSKTISAAGFSFTLTRYVVGVGTSPDWNYKRVYLSVASTSGPPFTYSAQTDISGPTTNAVGSTFGIDIELQAVDSSGAVLTDPNQGGNTVVPPDGFPVTITGASTASGSTSDGAYTNLTIGSGADTCAVSSGAPDWLTYPSLSTSDTFACTVPGDYVRQWEPVGCSNVVGTGEGTLTVTVLDSSGSGINGASVTLAALAGQHAPGGVKTNSSGVATFTNVPAGPWSASVAQLNAPPPALPGTVYNASTGSTACVFDSYTSQLNIVMVIGTSTATISVPVQNSAPGGTGTMELAATSGTDTYYQQQSVDVGSAPTLTLNPPSGSSYSISLYCIGVGGGTTPKSTLATWTSGILLAGQTYTPSGVSSSSPASGEC